MAHDAVKYLIQCYIKERTSTDVKLFQEDPDSISNGDLLNVDSFGKPLPSYSSAVIWGNGIAKIWTPVSRRGLQEFAEILNREAGRLEIHHLPPAAGQRDMLQNGGFNEDERGFLRNIFSLSPKASVRSIGEYLKSCITPGTVYATLQFISTGVTSFRDEVNATCEIAAIVLPSIESLTERREIGDMICSYLELRPQLEELLGEFQG